MKLGTIVAKNVRALRLQKGLSQRQLADKTKLTVRYISRLENTSPNLTLEVLEKLSRALDVSPCEIVCNGQTSVRKDAISIETLERTIQFLQGIQSRLEK